MIGSGLISVIIPVFNVRPYLTKALESVIRQTYSHLEIIVVDDGSTDGSGDICDEFAARDERIKVIHQENRGLSNARNTGLDIIGISEKLPKRIKYSLEKGKEINQEWNDDELSYLINNCVNILCFIKRKIFLFFL